MASLAALLEAEMKAQNKFVDGNQALIVFGLQNDFVGPNPRVPVPLESGWLDRIKELIPKFRHFAGDVIFVRSEVDPDALKDLDSSTVILDSSDTDGAADKEIAAEAVLDDDDESPKKDSKKKKKKKKRNRMTQFLKELKKKDAADAPHPSATNEIEDMYRQYGGTGAFPCVVPESDGAAFSGDVQALIQQPQDIVVLKRNFSAFKGTNLIVQLRMRFITELYLVGCMSNLSVFATAQDAASHGLRLNIVMDCMGYRAQKRHDIAMGIMVEHMGAYVTSSSAILEAFENPLDDNPGVQTPDNVGDAAAADDLTAALSNLGLDGKASSPRTPQDRSMDELARSLAASSLNRRSLNSPQSQSNSRPPTADASNEAQSPLSSKNLRSSKSTPDIRNKGNVRIRMRRRNEAELPKVPELPKTANPQAKTAHTSSDKSQIFQSTLNSEENKEHASKSEKTKEAHQPHLLDPRALISAAVRSKTDAKHAEKSPTPGPTNTDLPDHKNASVFSDKALAYITTEQSQTGKDQQAMKNPLKSFKKFKNLSNLPSLGPDDVIGEGDSSIKYDLLGKELRDELDPDQRLSDTVFRAIYHEVQWQKMFHAAGEVPRLVAVQGAIGEDGSKPVYRHPSDQSPPLLPFTKHVDIVRQEAEKVVGHELNHVLIQLYRSGQDYISEHSDKTLDIKKGSSIVNASFGAQRTMRLRTKRSAMPTHDETIQAAAGIESTGKGEEVTTGVERVTQRIHMPHNSLFVLGLKTNQYWLHGINQDKRAARDRAEEELAFNGMRISLTFRQIDTFLSADEKHIWGQGAKSKTKKGAGECVNADATEAQRMIDAFGVENREGAKFEWNEVYGQGFDVLNMKEAAKDDAPQATVTEESGDVVEGTEKSKGKEPIVETE